MEKTSTEDLAWEVLPEDFPQYDMTFKLIVIGDAFVGKSCLTSKGTKNSFDTNYSATVGFEFLHTNIKINDKVVKLQIWDTCGQEVYRSLITNFYRNSGLAIMVYSIDNYESFENIDQWLKELKTFSNPDIKLFLIGNKADLEQVRKVDKEQGETFQKDHNIDYFTETSAKTGFNAQKIFIEAAKLLYLDNIRYSEKNVKYREGSVLSISSSGSDFKKKLSVVDQSTEKEKSGCSC